MSPPYKTWIEEGMIQSLRLAKNVTSHSEYNAVLMRYIKGFKIEHLFLTFSQSKPSNTTMRKQQLAFVENTPGNGIWIRLPSFDTDNNMTLANSLKKIIRSMPNYRNKSYIVIDTRNNFGGNGTFARPLMISLYGEKFLKSLGPDFIWNKKWVQLDILSPALLAVLKNQSSEQTLYLQYKKRYLAGQKFVRKSTWPAYSSYQDRQFKMKNPVRAKIILLTNKKCYSMCYEINRTWLQLPNTILLGQAPNTMGLITNPVPHRISHYVTLYLASSIYLSPISAFNNKLVPKQLYSSDINNTVAVKAWVMRYLNKAAS
jgi:hypothetical protein